ncbi:hypothetical protein O181_020287 [Austropuccinia psidii MF-1]|uniref:Uncharacterized protein n=1 Tax=Austropuccinia psidii MF-1 TaxID=1389203 RepID=A0A9Q3CD68_9BASI|nr:hypothetical protein [Austropuccinia psidii MF-1]
MKEIGHVSLYIADFRILMSRIGDWAERVYSNVYKRGLASRLLDQLASYPGNFYTLQELMDITLKLDTRYHDRKKEKGSHQSKKPLLAYINFYKRGLASRLLDQLASYSGNFDTLQELMEITLKLDTRYHERQKEKGGHQEKKPLVTGSSSSRPPQDSSSKRPYHKKNKTGKQFQPSKDKPHSALLNKENKLIVSEKERRIKEGLCTYCGGKHPIEKIFKRPQNKPGSSRGFPRKQGKV